MTAGRNEKGGTDFIERDTDEAGLPELTEEAKERIFARIQASLDGSDEDLEDSPE